MTKVYCEQSGNIFMCVRCFGTGIEKLNHKKTNDYHLINDLEFPLVDLKWTAHEELLLLDGLAKFGYGNWVDVAAQVGTKSKEECEKHYKNVFQIL